MIGQRVRLLQPALNIAAGTVGVIVDEIPGDDTIYLIRFDGNRGAIRFYEPELSRHSPEFKLEILEEP